MFDAPDMGTSSPISLQTSLWFKQRPQTGPRIRTSSTYLTAVSVPPLATVLEGTDTRPMVTPVSQPKEAVIRPAKTPPPTSSSTKAPYPSMERRTRSALRSVPEV